MVQATSSATELRNEQLIFSHSGYGLTSRAPVDIAVYHAEPNSGIKFSIPNPKAAQGIGEDRILVPARAEYVVNTLRNTVLGSGGARLCIVEHFLAAAALWGLNDLFVVVDGPEMPLADGSAGFWMELFERSSVARKKPDQSIELLEAVCVEEGDRQIIAVPAQKLTLTYMLDWPHPMIGRCWRSWSADQHYAEIASARTFGSARENEMLGVANEVVSVTEEGFNKPLIFEDEPVRHKILDLLGDLVLVGINPLALKAHVISIKGGHKLDVEMAKRMRQTLHLS